MTVGVIQPRSIGMDGINGTDRYGCRHLEGYLDWAAVPCLLEDGCWCSPARVAFRPGLSVRGERGSSALFGSAALRITASLFSKQAGANPRVFHIAL